MKRRSITGVLLIAVLALAAFAPTAAADQPVTTVTTFDHTFTIAAGPNTCRFPIAGHTQGALRETVYSNGKDVTHAVNFHITYTNPANGKTLTTVLAGPFIVEPNADRTAPVTVNGNGGPLTGPGQGSIFADVGKLVYIADPLDVFTPLSIVKSTGHQDPNQFPAPCQGLA